MHKIALFFLFLSIVNGYLFAKDNTLIAARVIPKSVNRVLVNFQFAQPLKQVHTRFTTQMTPRLVIDFSNSNNQIAESLKTKKIDFSILHNYHITTVGNRVRVIMELSSEVLYSGSTSDRIYTLVLNKKINQFQQTTDHLSTVAVRQTGLEKKSYGAKSITLNFQSIQVRAVLQLLAEFTGTDLVVSDKVTGSITLSLNDIPWDQALDIILKTRALGKRKIGKVMLIAPLEEITEQEKKELQAEMDLINLSPMHSDLLQINYAKAAEIAAVLYDKNKTVLSARGRLTVDVRTNTIWIRDNRAQIEEIRELVKQLDIPVKQVLIEARIVNVTKDFAQDLGLHFSMSNPSCSNSTLRCAEQLLKNTQLGDRAGLAERLNVDLVAMPIASSPASIGIALAKLDSGVLLDLELSALESEGRGEIISSPRLLTTDQQAAFIESGEEIPYQEATASGATAVAFKKAVLSLKVTPQITSDSKILMDLQINQNTLSAKVFNGVPAILTKEVHTNALVNNGQTIVLGGIYKRDKNNIINRVPFLGELPLIGALLKNQSTMVKNEELLIFITPRIITNNLVITSSKEPLHRFVGSVELDKFGKQVGTTH